MERRIFFAVSVVALLLVPVLVFAQAGNFDIRYDPMTVKTVSGSVVSTIDFNPGCPSAGPSGVIITSEGQNYTVFLGPDCFIKQMGLTLPCGDIITVTASLRCVQGKNYLVASRVIADNKTYDLRTTNGIPLWPTCPPPCPPPCPQVCPPPCPAPCPPVGAGPCQTCPPVAQPCPQACPPPPCGPLTQPYDLCCPKRHPCDTCPREGACHSCAPASAPPCQTCPPVGAGPCQTCPQPSCNPCQTAPPPSCNPCPPVGAGPQTVAVPFDACNMVSGHGVIAGTEIMQTNESETPYLVALVKGPFGYGRSSTRVILAPLASVGVFDLCRGRAIAYTGSAVEIQGESFVVATSISQGPTFLGLRTLNGASMFSQYVATAGTPFMAADNNF